MRMRSGWDVLLSGERVARGRLHLGDGRVVRGVVRQDVDQGVRVACDVFGEDPLGSDQVLEAALEERGGAGVVKGAVRAVA